MKAAYVTRAKFDRLEMSHRQLAAQVVALTAVIGAMGTTGTVDYERLEQCVNFAAGKLRLGHQPILLAQATALLGEFEKMQRALQVEGRKKRGLRKLLPRTTAVTPSARKPSAPREARVPPRSRSAA